MRCEKCGALLGNRLIKINGVLLCENCAREVTRDQQLLFNSAFPILDELTGGFMNGGLDFANTRITCSKCGSTLRDIEASGKVGCIDCYNTFNETILKFLLKRQGNSEYRGRSPGEEILIETAGNEEDDPVAGNKDEVNAAEKTSSARRTAKKKAEDKPEEKTEKVSAKKTEKASDTKAGASREDRIAKLNKADLGMLDDKALEDGMKLAVECEDYALAARLRDELKSRKGDK